MAGMGGAPPVVTVPAAPTGLALSVQGNDKVKLTWTDVATDETGYYVYWAAGATKPATPNLFLPAGTTTITADGLTSGTQYTFWVQAYNAAGSSTALSAMATPGPVPNAPTALVVTPSATDLTLTWTDGSTDETGFRIYVATTNTQPTTTTYSVAAGVTTFKVPAAALTPYTPVYIWVTAFNAIGDSVAATGTGAAGIAPTAPTGVTVAYDPANRFAVNASWTDTSDNENGFNVYWSTDDTKPATAGATVAANIATYKLTKVFGASTYRFWVEAANVVGTSAATQGTATVATTDQNWPELWVDDAMGTHLAIVKNVNDPATTTLFAYYSADPLVMGTGSTIDPWKIYAKADINFTKTAYFWTETRTPEGSLFGMRTLVPGPSPVANVVVTPNDTGATVTWTPIVGYTGRYQVLWGTDTEATAAIGASSATGTATLTGLLPGTDYKFWVRTAGVGINTLNAANRNGIPGTATLTLAKTTGVNLGTNLARGKPTGASSNNNSALAVDGVVGGASRWESASNDNEWMYVDLGATTTITHAKMIWEGAYSKTLEIQTCAATCADGGAAAGLWPWVTVYVGADRTLTGFPNSELVKLANGASGRYVRMLGKTRATVYGHSMYEFEIYNAPVAP